MKEVHVKITQKLANGEIGTLWKGYLPYIPSKGDYVAVLLDEINLAEAEGTVKEVGWILSNDRGIYVEIEIDPLFDPPEWWRPLANQLD